MSEMELWVQSISSQYIAPTVLKECKERDTWGSCRKHPRGSRLRVEGIRFQVIEGGDESVVLLQVMRHK